VNYYGREQNIHRNTYDLCIVSVNASQLHFFPHLIFSNKGIRAYHWNNTFILRMY